MKSKEKEVQKEEENNAGIHAVLEEMEEDFLSPDIIQDNKIPFSQKGVLYRVRVPNQVELFQAKEKRNLVYIQLLQMENTLTKKKLKKVLKEKEDTDIDLMQKEVDDLGKEIQELYISLAPCRDEEVKTIAKFKGQIKKVKAKRKAIADKIIEKIAPCIEVRADDAYMEHLTYILTETFKVESEKDDTKKGEWIPVWKTFEEFEKDMDRNLRLTATGWLTFLIANDRG